MGVGFGWWGCLGGGVLVRREFGGLAGVGIQERPSLSVVRNLLTSLGITSDSIIADVGAGTGKYSADLLKFSFVKRIIAVEPNDAMRNEGERLMIDPRVVWKKAQERTRDCRHHRSTGW